MSVDKKIPFADSVGAKEVMIWVINKLLILAAVYYGFIEGVLPVQNVFKFVVWCFLLPVGLVSVVFHNTIKEALACEVAKRETLIMYFTACAFLIAISGVVAADGSLFTAGAIIVSVLCGYVARALL